MCSILHILTKAHKLFIFRQNVLTSWIFLTFRVGLSVYSSFRLGLWLTPASGWAYDWQVTIAPCTQSIASCTQRTF